MTKTQYLADPHVKNFIQWMSENLTNDTLAHSYTNRVTNECWTCTSLIDAVSQYNWTFPSIPDFSVTGGSSFKDNSNALGVLQSRLFKALEIENNNSDFDACQAAIAVMTWGNVRAWNVQWLQANQIGLRNLLLNVSSQFNSGNTSQNPKKLRFNAGMTKVYSLLCNDFIIYDSRVAAALGWAVVKFCKNTKLKEVPQGLAFPWAPAKENSNAINPKRRNPSENGLQFPRLRSGNYHADWNLKASWLLKAILEQTAEQDVFKDICQPKDTLRAFEAALFMIGYDLGHPKQP
jgi:hypothetical protein